MEPNKYDITILDSFLHYTLIMHRPINHNYMFSRNLLSIEGGGGRWYKNLFLEQNLLQVKIIMKLATFMYVTEPGKVKTTSRSNTASITGSESGSSKTLLCQTSYKKILFHNNFIQYQNKSTIVYLIHKT